MFWKIVKLQLQLQLGSVASFPRAVLFSPKYIVKTSKAKIDYDELVWKNGGFWFQYIIKTNYLIQLS